MEIKEAIAQACEAVRALEGPHRAAATGKPLVAYCHEAMVTADGPKWPISLRLKGQLAPRGPALFYASSALQIEAKMRIAGILANLQPPLL